MINIIVVDDQLLFRESIGYLLENDDEINIVAMCKNGNEAIKSCERYRIDIVLMDIEMPEMDGIAATKIIKEKFKDIRIIILTTFENSDNIMKSFVCDADGYLLKNISHKDLVRSIKCVNSGLTVIDESVKKIMVERFMKCTQGNSHYKEVLSNREIEIIKHIASGSSNKEIGLALGFSLGTIKNSVSKILDKLKVEDRVQIAVFAIENEIE